MTEVAEIDVADADLFVGVIHTVGCWSKWSPGGCR